jgi:hypothetical protein
MRLGVYAVFLALFLLSAAGHLYTIDSYLNYSVTASIATRGTLEIPGLMMTVEGTGGRHFSKLGVGQSLAAVPLYWIGSGVERAYPEGRAFRAYSRRFLVPPPGGGEPVTAEPQTLIRASDRDGARVFFPTLACSFFAAGVCTFFWAALRRYGLSPGRALAATFLPAVATPLWVYARDFFAEPLFALSLVGVFYLVTTENEGRRPANAALAGGLSSIGILARVSYLPLVGLFGLYLLFTRRDRRKDAAWYVLASLPGALAVGLINLYKFGSPLMSGYHTAFDKGFSTPLIKGIFWNLASPYRSLFLYAPPVILFFLGLRWFGRRYRGHLFLLSGIFIYMLVLYSGWWAWHGGWCWGPRFLVPVMPLMMLPGLAAWAGGKRWLGPAAVILGVAGLAVNLGAILVNYTAIYDYWIKIGVLDWAEAGVQWFWSVWDHSRAWLATPPGDYDLWIIQACRTGEPVRPVVVISLVALAAAGAASVIRSRYGDRPTS